MSGRVSYLKNAASAAAPEGNRHAAPITRDQIAASLRALCSRYGDGEAVAALIAARWDVSTCAATVSRMRAGSLEWRLIDVIALEDGLGTYPITRLMLRRMATDRAPILDAVTAAKSAAKEAGEAIAAITGAVIDPSDADRAAAITEIDEAIEALRQARASLGAAADTGGSNG